MQQKQKKTTHRRKTQRKLVTVALAGDIELARHYKKILLKYGIHSVVRTVPNGPFEFHFELLVQQGSFETAYNVIEANNPDQDFFSAILEIDQPRPKAV